ncbi:MAG: hypothetical protein R3D00_17650 [Bacteroidia bacterium]
MNKYALIFCGVILLLLTALLTGCKCDDPTNPECPNYNPCMEEVPLNADFVMEESFSSDIALPLQDTMYKLSQLLLTAVQEMESYEWIIGTDTNHRKTPSVVIEFGYPYGPIPITLIGKRKSSACFPGDDGIDTVTKTVYVVDLFDLPLWGKYRGQTTSRVVDSFTVELAVEWDTFMARNIAVMNNFFPDCHTRNFRVGATGFDLYATEGWDCEHYTVTGTGKLSPSKDTLDVYFYRAIGNSYVQDTFTGIRIPQ